MRLVRPPAPALRPFVKALWAVNDDLPAGDAPTRERILPTGEMHLVFRLSDDPVRLHERANDRGHAVGLAVVGGMRTAPYLRDVPPRRRSVGVQLHPGVARLVLGVPADALAGRHWALEDLWGAEAARARERLLDAEGLSDRLDTLEALLAERLPRPHALHPAVALAIERFGAAASVGEVVRETGRSHRAFIALFRSAMGVSPKVYCRVQRFQRVIRRLAADPWAVWSDVALDAGYSDQPHFVREFRRLAGLAPSEYRALAPRAHHVPLRAPR